MNIIEAVRDGRPFKRKIRRDYLDRPVFGVSIEDVLAEDWEVLRKVTVDEGALREALYEAFRLGQTLGDYFPSEKPCIDAEIQKIKSSLLEESE